MYSLWTIIHEDQTLLGRFDSWQEANALALTLDYAPADIWIYDTTTEMEYPIEIPAS